MTIPILYEDDNILAVDKPSGVLVDVIAAKYPKFILAHRLDKGTSGVLLLAKNEKAREFLKNQFKNREVKKFYHAIVVGNVKKDHGVINKPIGRSPRDFRRRLAGRGARGEMREAITEYRVLRRFKAGKRSDLKNSKRSDLEEAFTYLEVKPKTGRTHQIRVHLKFFNYPVVGDILYNPKGLPLPNLPLCRGRSGGGIPRMMLHALSIEFKIPSGKMIKVESPLPKVFNDLLSDRVA